jgi:hypothetical protein
MSCRGGGGGASSNSGVLSGHLRLATYINISMVYYMLKLQGGREDIKDIHLWGVGGGAMQTAGAGGCGGWWLVGGAGTAVNVEREALPDRCTNFRLAACLHMPYLVRQVEVCIAGTFLHLTITWHACIARTFLHRIITWRKDSRHAGGEGGGEEGRERERKAEVCRPGGTTETRGGGKGRGGGSEQRRTVH